MSELEMKKPLVRRRSRCCPSWSRSALRGVRPRSRDARGATDRFHDVDAAIAAGYSFRLPDQTGATCIVAAGQGAMGVHMVNTSLLDGVLDATSRRRSSTSETAGREARASPPSSTSSSSPPGRAAASRSCSGSEFDFVPEGNRYGLPAFYALHAWLWQRQPERDPLRLEPADRLQVNERTMPRPAPALRPRRAARRALLTHYRTQS